MFCLSLFQGRKKKIQNLASTLKSNNSSKSIHFSFFNCNVCLSLYIFLSLLIKCYFTVCFFFSYNTQPTLVSIRNACVLTQVLKNKNKERERQADSSTCRNDAIIIQTNSQLNHYYYCVLTGPVMIAC